MKRIRSAAALHASMATLILAPSLAEAHPGFHADGFIAGALHPLGGLDHLLAMVAVGLWAASLGRRARIVVPGAFVATMALCAVLGAEGAAVPGIEAGIAASVVMLGLAVAFRVAVPTLAASAIVALFAAAHGLAHGGEMPAMASPLAYGIGFALVTAGLHAAGLVAGLLAARTQAPRLAGGVISLAGV
jgi:urease accessory protein